MRRETELASLKGMMRRTGLSAFIALAVIPASIAIVACSGDDHPPILDTKDAAFLKDVAVGEPCQTPAPGCPCPDAGSEEYCGVIYRVVGDHVDCAKGSMKCTDEGTWGKCEGPSVYGAE
ncbi:hypothetical protein BH09MYX1_BH09MYX1_17750 [soil metagenome]